MNLDGVVSRLESAVADLDEIAFDLLREAVADGETQRPPEDRELAKARRAIEKAIGILRNLDEPSPD